MAIGFPAYYKDRKQLVFSKEKTKELAIKALGNMECKEIGLHPFALDYQSLGTILTAGERIYVNVTEEEIIIRSECIFFSTIIDFGKNKANIAKFWKEYESLIAKEDL